VVGHPDGAHLALGDQRAEGVGERRRMGEQVGPVDLVEVDHVDPEAPQRGLARSPQRRGRGVVGHRRHDPTLGGQHDAVSQAGAGGEDPAEERLVGPESGAAPVEAVDVGVIDEVHPQADRGLEEIRGRTGVGADEPPAAERERTDRQRGPREGPGRRVDQSGHDQK